MEGTYPVLLGEEEIGKVTVFPQGLYYRISCRCRLTGEVIYKLAAARDGERVSLGVCVPMEGLFGLETRLPKKRLGEKAPEFWVIPKGGELPGFVPLSPEEPFSYICRLKNAYLANKDGKIGVVFRD